MLLSRRTLLGSAASALAATTLIPSRTWAQSATPPPTAEGIWPIGQGANPARNRNMPGPGPEGDPILLWKYPQAGTTSIAPFDDQGVFADDRLYLAAGNTFLAVDAHTGRERWRASDFSSIPAIDGDGIILRGTSSSGDGYDLVRLLGTDGSLVWRTELGKLIDGYTPVVANGVGYTPSGTDLIAFDPATGAAKWRTRLATPGFRGTAIDAGMAVIPDQAGTFYGIDITDGHIVWTLATGYAEIGTPSISNGTAYFAGNVGNPNAYCAVNLTTGDLLWSFPSPNGLQFRNGAFDDNTVYCSTLDGTIYALDLSTGTLRWSIAVSPTLDTNSALVGDTLYVTTPDGFIRAFATGDGSERWRFELDASSNFPPIVVSGVVYVATLGGTIYAIGGAESAAAAGLTPIAASATPAPNGSNAPVTFVWAAKGNADHKLFHPGTVALDPTGNAWVTSMTGSFFILDPNGNLINTWGSVGSGDSQFAFSDFGGNDFGSILFAPEGGGGGFFVADTFNFRIQQFDQNRNLVRIIGSQGEGDGQFLAPGGMAFDDQGNLLVADLLRHNVQRFAPDGSYLNAFGGEGSGPRQFENPGLITVAPDGNLWIADISNNRIQIVKQDGSFVSAFGQAGNGHGSFSGPDQVAFDTNGHAFITDQFNDIVQVFDMQGQFLYQFGGLGTSDGQFSTATSIAIDPNNAAYVVDWRGNRLQKFQITGPVANPTNATPVAG